MNERIREFIDKANGYWEHGDFNMPKTVCFSEHDIELFAELIVRECVICAEREWIRNGLGTEHNQAVSKVIESIKEHFGVEE